MRRLLLLVSRFGSDDRGVFGILFAVMAIVLVAMGGAVVDYVSVQQARTRAQVALDSAVLALQPKIFATPTPSENSLRAQAETLLFEQLSATGDWQVCSAEPQGTQCVAVDSARINVTDGVLELQASLNVPMNFVSLVGFNDMSARLLAEATRKRLNLEVAMVLDNSNSMKDFQRMENLISATRCATNILLNEDCDSRATTTTVENVSIGIVPFTMVVNVGPDKKNEPWIDRSGTGANNISRDNFDDDDNEGTPFTGPIDRIALFDKLKNVTWGGCVEARRSPYDTTDTPPDPSNPTTLFTPLFAPDPPDNMGTNYVDDMPASCPRVPVCVQVQEKSQCNSTGTSERNYNNATCTGKTTTTYRYTSETGAVSTPSSCPSWAHNNDPVIETSYGPSSGSANNRTATMRRTETYTYLSMRARQERLCKYDGATARNVSQANARGPNLDCPTNPILPLTSDKTAISRAIDALAPQGGTNIHEGTAWGFRVLSPSAPFSEGQPYSSNTSKVMIVMTDGDNTSYQANNMNNSTYYSAYGFPYNERLGTMSSDNNDLQTEMDRRTKATCDNAKAAGITIYTIGLSTTRTTSVTMLKECSSGTGYWFFPDQASQLTNVFKTIALQLAALRLAK